VTELESDDGMGNEEMGESDEERGCERWTK
jgi:hypothetical protein